MKDEDNNSDEQHPTPDQSMNDWIRRQTIERQQDVRDAYGKRLFGDDEQEVK